MYLTVAIAVERNMAAYFPLTCKTNNDDSRKRRCIYIVYVAIATVMAFFASRPNFEESFGAMPLINEWHYRDFKILLAWLYSVEKLVLNIIVPLTALIGFNFSLYVKTRKFKAEDCIHNVALAIIGVSVICALPKIASFVINLTNLDFECLCSNDHSGPFPVFYIAFKLDITFSYFNIAANFLILYLYGSKFRAILKQKLQKGNDFMFGCCAA